MHKDTTDSMKSARFFREDQWWEVTVSDLPRAEAAPLSVTAANAVGEGPAAQLTAQPAA